MTTVIGLAGLLLATGCGTEGESGPPLETDRGASSAYPDPLVTENGELLVGCGGDDGFPVTVLADGVPGVLTQAEAEAIFTELLADERYGPEMKLSFLREGASGTDWRVLRDEGDGYLLGLGDWFARGPAQDASVMAVERGADGWEWVGGGDCGLQPLLEPGNTWAELSRPATGLDRGSAVLTVDVRERGCTSGRDARPHLHDPVVVESAGAVTAYWTSTPPRGDQNCIGNAPTAMQLELEQPLGDRELLDGSTYPPAPIPDTLSG